ncbi:hypothetical protein CTAYLR_002706 [Chrysophaeum taylorii]|uniref:Beta-lactamase-related domain-containing protein n=1 Tax=Chrysophaeum taylorii TaxID=2483200 RepID=A0AAD7XJT9_9STRA|nr:hypothetical protein CTAYLR_002706 [Chrysophaeum taylorii]
MPGVLFEYSNVDMHPDVVLQLASGSKWPGVTALMGCFAANNISIDTKLSKYLDWWTTNASDSRSNVTIRQVLSMTTGMITDPGGDGVFAEIANLSVAAFEDCDLEGGNTAQCARAMYEALPSQVVPVYLPGTKFLYTTLGFQWTAAVAEVVEGRPIGDILNAYVLDKAGMSPDCSWSNQDVNPLIGAGLECSARKLDKFVHGMLVDGIVSTKTRLEMETVQLTEPSMYGSASLYWGAYCLGNWLECLNNYRLKRLMPSQCFRADRHGALLLLRLSY